MMISWPETVSEDIASFKHSRSLMHAPEAPEDRCSLPVRHYIYIYIELSKRLQKRKSKYKSVLFTFGIDSSMG